MSFDAFPEFNYDDLTWFKNNSIYGDDLGFNEPSWDESNTGGPSQQYTGVDVLGDFNDYPDFLSPSIAPTSLYPTHGGLPDEGYRSPSYQGAAVQSFPPQPATTSPPPSIPHTSAAPSPVPTLSYGSCSLSPELYGAPTTPAYYPHAQPQAALNLDDLGYYFTTGVGSSSLPAVHHPPAREPSYEELGHQFHQPAHPYPNPHPFEPTTCATLPEIPLPPPVASLSGPARTRQSMREGRRYNPIKATEKAAAKKEGWDRTLPRFRAKLHDTLYSVRNGQPSGGLVPAVALAEVEKLVKEDLKRSPLQEIKAGEGTRSRNMEDYLKGLLGAIHRLKSIPKPDASGSDEDDTSVATLSRLAGELEAELVAVNQQPALRRALVTSKPGESPGDEQVEGQVRKGKLGGQAESKSVGRGEKSKGRAKKSKSEMKRRDAERHQLERMCSLFKAPKRGWTRKEALSLGILLRLYGPEAFPPGFVVVRPAAPGCRLTVD